MKRWQVIKLVWPDPSVDHIEGGDVGEPTDDLGLAFKAAASILRQHKHKRIKVGVGDLWGDTVYEVAVNEAGEARWRYIDPPEKPFDFHK